MFANKALFVTLEVAFGFHVLQTTFDHVENCLAHTIDRLRSLGSARGQASAVGKVCA